MIKARSSQALRNKLHTLNYRHIAIAIGRVFVDEMFRVGTQDNIGEVKEAEIKEESALEISAGRTERIGVNQYGVSSDIIKHLSIQSVKTFRPLSKAWHQFLGIGGVDNTRARELFIVKAGQKHARGRSDALSMQLVLQKIGPGTREYRAEQIKRAMQQALGSNKVSFRSDKQKQGVEAVLTGHTPLVIVLPIGGGKSLLFIAPAYLEDPGVTIVIMPFQALLGNLIDRLKKARIDYME